MIGAGSVPAIDNELINPLNQRIQKKQAEILNMINGLGPIMPSFMEKARGRLQPMLGQELNSDDGKHFLEQMVNQFNAQLLLVESNKQLEHNQDDPVKPLEDAVKHWEDVVLPGIAKCQLVFGEAQALTAPAGFNKVGDNFQAQMLAYAGILKQQQQERSKATFLQLRESRQAGDGPRTEQVKSPLERIGELRAWLLTRTNVPRDRARSLTENESRQIKFLLSLQNCLPKTEEAMVMSMYPGQDTQHQTPLDDPMTSSFMSLAEPRDSVTSALNIHGTFPSDQQPKKQQRSRSVDRKDADSRREQGHPTTITRARSFSPGGRRTPVS